MSVKGSTNALNLLNRVTAFVRTPEGCVCVLVGRTFLIGKPRETARRAAGDVCD